MRPGLLVLVAVSAVALAMEGVAFWPMTVNRHTSVDATRSSAEVNWKTYINTRYNFSFRYPVDFEGSTDDGYMVAAMSGQTWKDKASKVVVFSSNAKLPGVFEITAHDRQNNDPTACSDDYYDPAGFWSPPLQELIPTIYQSASKDEPVSSPLKTSVAGKTAYQFTVSRYIGWNGSGRSVDEENLWIFIENRSTVLEVSLPHTPTFEEILQTMKFTTGVPTRNSTNPLIVPSMRSTST